MNLLDLHQSAHAVLVRGGRAAAQSARARRPAPASHQISLASGEFLVDHYRNGKRINCYRFRNGITNEGKNKLLDVMFNADTAISAWFLGLIDNDSFTALAAGDTYAEIDDVNGWGEFTDYDDPGNGGNSTTRPGWTVGNASSQSVTNSSIVAFDITGTGTVKGVFVVGGGSDPEVKGDNAGGGALWATALFTGGDVPVQSGDTLRVTYTVNA